MQHDEQIFDLIIEEQDRQIHGLELIASIQLPQHALSQVALALAFSTNQVPINDS